MTDVPKMGVRVEKRDTELHLVFVLDSSERTDLMAAEMVRQMLAGQLLIQLNGQPTMKEDGSGLYEAPPTHTELLMASTKAAAMMCLTQQDTGQTAKEAFQQCAIAIMEAAGLGESNV